MKAEFSAERYVGFIVTPALTLLKVTAVHLLVTPALSLLKVTAIHLLYAGKKAVPFHTPAKTSAKTSAAAGAPSAAVPPETTCGDLAMRVAGVADTGIARQ